MGILGSITNGAGSVANAGMDAAKSGFELIIGGPIKALFMAANHDSEVGQQMVQGVADAGHAVGNAATSVAQTGVSKSAEFIGHGLDHVAGSVADVASKRMV